MPEITFRQLKAAFLAVKMRKYKKLPSPTMIASWLDEFGAMPDKDKVRRYSHLAHRGATND